MGSDDEMTKLVTVIGNLLDAPDDANLSERVGKVMRFLERKGYHFHGGERAWVPVRISLWGRKKIVVRFVDRRDSDRIYWLFQDEDPRRDVVNVDGEVEIVAAAKSNLESILQSQQIAPEPGKWQRDWVEFWPFVIIARAHACTGQVDWNEMRRMPEIRAKEGGEA